MVPEAEGTQVWSSIFKTLIAEVKKCPYLLAGSVGVATWEEKAQLWLIAVQGKQFSGYTWPLHCPVLFASYRT